MNHKFINLNYYFFIPDNINTIIFGISFNQPIELLNSLETLSFVNGIFNHSVKLSNGLKFINFGYEFNHPIELPDNLISLILGIKF